MPQRLRPAGEAARFNGTQPLRSRGLVLGRCTLTGGARNRQPRTRSRWSASTRTVRIRPTPNSDSASSTTSTGSGALGVPKESSALPRRSQGSGGVRSSCAGSTLGSMGSHLDAGLRVQAREGQLESTAVRGGRPLQQAVRQVREAIRLKGGSQKTLSSSRWRKWSAR